jgi:hypothetical protein
MALIVVVVVNNVIDDDEEEIFVVDVEVIQYQLENDDDYESNKVDDEVKFVNFVKVELMLDYLKLYYEDDDDDEVNDDLFEVCEHLVVVGYNLIDFHLLNDRYNVN